MRFALFWKENTYLQSLNHNRILVVEKTGNILIVNRANIFLQGAFHDHDLILLAIPGDTSEPTATMASHLQKNRLVSRLDEGLVTVRDWPKAD